MVDTPDAEALELAREVEFERDAAIKAAYELCHIIAVNRRKYGAVATKAQSVAWQLRPHLRNALAQQEKM